MEFLPSLSVLSAFTVATLIVVITPGPDMTLFLGRALTQGRLAGMVAMLGTACGIIIHTLLAAFGISALIQASPQAFFALKLAGAVYLLWLAVQAIRQGSAFNLEKTEKKRVSHFNNWITGVGIDLLNPKIVLFFITFLPQFVSAEDSNVTGKMIFLGLYFVMFIIGLSSLMIYSVDKISDLLRRNRAIMRMIDWMFAGVFSTFAVRILLIER